MDLKNIASLSFFLPEIILSVTILLLIVLDLLARSKDVIGPIAAIGCVIALIVTFDLYSAEPGLLFHRMIVLDRFSLFFKIFALSATILTIWMSLGNNEIKQVHQGEFYALLLTCALGIFFMASASNLLMAYLSLELVSLTSYVLTGFLPHNRRSSEAALKYLIYGGVASGTMIYGMSWIFGMAGSLDYATIQTALAQEGINKAALFIAFIFIMAGFGYKIAFVPFHMWSPDVYQGAPTPFTAFLSVASNAAGIAIMIRFFYPGVSRMVPGGDWSVVSGVEWPHVLLFVSMITMTLGNLCALNQKNLKRMLAYSGIAHAGYMLMGLAVLTNDGLSAILFYVVVYLIMNLGAFLVVGMVANVTGDEEIESYRGLAWRGAALPAACLAIFLFSLTGLPPFAGFIGKFFLFAAVLKQGGAFVMLAVVAILNSVISLYYYARVVKTMFLDTPEPTDKAVSVAANNFALLIPLTVLTVVLGVYFSPLAQFTSQSLRFFVK
ncbi:MAG: NADH-quinone oxidoreductase subunit N [Deltaproteobacteria bacterium]|nr:NADH-quinone oxidoreductase subunit N [Deltaproteobacteria bacterium]MDZ4345917.1 NADH-quinone oxidoreductase subunit N [Candidatus Binatia bacterium]